MLSLHASITDETEADTKNKKRRIELEIRLTIDGVELMPILAREVLVTLIADQVLRALS